MATKGRKRKQSRRMPLQRAEVTTERGAHNAFVSAGMAMRVVPVIDTLRDTGQISLSEYDALNHYRNCAHKAQDDEADAGTLAPERIMGGGGRTIISGPLPAKWRHTPAIVETARIERELGALRDIARAVAVEDMSLTRWCIEKHGGREKINDGNVIEILPRGRKSIEFARLELRFAAGRIVR